MIHSLSTNLNADAIETRQYVITQHLQNAGCIVWKANTIEDVLCKLAKYSDLVVPQLSKCQDISTSDGRYAEQKSRKWEHVERFQQVWWPDQQFTDFVETVPDAMVIADQNGHIIRVNAQAEKLFGYSRGELIGREVEMLLPERFRGLYVGQRMVYFPNPGMRPMETDQQIYGLRKDGREFPAEISLSPLLVADRVHIACTIRDVTEDRRTEAELRHRAKELENAARHKDEFLGMLAHELRNPLGTIRNAVQVLTQLGPATTTLQWAQDVIGRQADHMTHLIEDLLDVCRIANGKVRIQKESVELGEIVCQAVEICKPLFIARQQRLTVSLPSRSVRLLADPTRLVQILTNLLNNAAKYSEEGGPIWLTATKEEAEVVVRVRDKGIGIAAEMQPCIFDLFAQVPEALDRSGGGIGIGLGIVSHLVQMHEGTVQAFSDGPGCGSEFVVRLPLPSATYPENDSD